MFETSTLFSQFGFGSFNNRHFMNEQIQDSPEISGIRFTMYVLPFAISQTLAWATCFYSFPAFLPEHIRYHLLQPQFSLLLWEDLSTKVLETQYFPQAPFWRSPLSSYCLKQLRFGIFIFYGFSWVQRCLVLFMKHALLF